MSQINVEIVNDEIIVIVNEVQPGDVTEDGAQTLTNKTINAADNTIVGLQPLDADLTAIAALTGTAGLLKKTAADTWALDTTSYSTLALGTSAGAALAASGAAGSATTAAKSDHVHPFPTVANVGAEPAITKAIGFAKWNGSAWSFDNSTYYASGGALGTPASGNLTNCTADGTNPVGTRNIPQVSQSANYTCVLTDGGKHLLHPAADTTARTFTIPANSSVAYPIGTAITFINQNGAGVLTIAITSDTMRLAGAGTTGSRTLAANGVATAIKVASAEWIISGVGLT